MERGVIYYNAGTSCAVRLLVSVFSLRRHYGGPVTILSEGRESDRLCERIARATDAAWVPWKCGVAPGKNSAYLAKTRYHIGTPYELTLALDSDTLVLGPIDELFDYAQQNKFCVAQLGKWKTNGRIIAKRIRGWKEFLPNDVELAVSSGPAINCGVVAFQRDAPIFEEWYELALLGRELFIPDESCCQVILHRYPHLVLDARWNRSCKYDNPNAPDTRIVHFHGRKHCRPGLPFHGELWMNTYEEVSALNLAEIQEWAPAGDKTLKRYLANARPRPLIASSQAHLSISMVGAPTSPTDEVREGASEFSDYTDLPDITLVLGVDKQHLEELRWVWPTWIHFKPEILGIPVLIFFDPTEVNPDEVEFLDEHPNIRWIPWEMPGAHTHREAMLTGWLHVPAREVRTTWYLKLDTDVVATASASWIDRSWFEPDEQGRVPVFISCKWGYTKPRYVMDLLDDWADHVPALAKFPRLNLPYSSSSKVVAHRRIISCVFFGLTAWTREVARWLGPDGRLPYPSQDSYLFYCAARSKQHYVRKTMKRFGWAHLSLAKIRSLVMRLGIQTAVRAAKRYQDPAGEQCLPVANSLSGENHAARC